MADVTRRNFLRTAGIGAAAIGVVGAGGASLLDSAGASPKATPIGGPAGIRSDEVPAAAAGDIFAHVSDVRAGKITVFHGTNAYTVTNPALAAALAQATK